MKLKVAIAGASGYVGGELARVLELHPNVELVTVTGNSSVGQSLGALNPELTKYADLVFVENTKENLAGHDVMHVHPGDGFTSQGPSGGVFQRDVGWRTELGGICC